MHYRPESSCEFLTGLSDGGARRSWSDVVAQHAPLYLLTFSVLALLLIDVATSGMWKPAGRPISAWAALLGSSRILFHTVQGLLSGRVGADFAVSLACVAAISLGEFSTAALVSLTALLGESLEGVAIDSARWALSRRLELFPAVAHRIARTDAATGAALETIDLPASDVAPGDAVEVRPGERFPADGVVRTGRSCVNENALTGESVPVDKAPGDRVWAGSLNGFGGLVVDVEQAGANTLVGQIQRLVSQASANRGPAMRLADRAARWFLPAVLVLSLGTLVGWRIGTGEWRRGVLPALSILVAACPCSLILATPAAAMAALASLARSGVVAKGASVLEQLANVDTLGVDKTGTLTTGELRVDRLDPAAGVELAAHELLEVAAVAARGSQHPLARSIIEEARRRRLAVPSAGEWTESPGEGVSVVWNDETSTMRDVRPGDVVRIGRRRWLEQYQVVFGADEGGTISAEDAASRVDVACGSRWLGSIHLTDRVRPEAASVLASLRDLGIRDVALLTGDRPEAARAVGRQLSELTSVSGGLLPADKADWALRQQQAGRVVAMLGDGVNDAVALTTADVGIAVRRTGADLAEAAAQLVLLGDSLRSLPPLWRTSRRFVSIVQQNIYGFGLGVNAVAVGLSASGWLHPVAAAAIHEAGSLAVMLNSLRLLAPDRSTRSAALATAPRTASTAFVQFLRDAAAVVQPQWWAPRIVERWRPAAALLAGCGLLGWLASNLVCLSEAEIAIVTRCGKHQARLEAGWHWRWPSPWERVVRVEPRRLRVVEIGYRSPDRPAEPSGAPREDVEWTSEHRAGRSVHQPDEAIMLTGDGLPADVNLELTYRISNPVDFALAAPPELDQVLRGLAEAALRHVASRAAWDDVVSERRGEFADLALQQVRDDVNQFRWGVDVVDLLLHDVHPPVPVVPAFRDVADASEQLDELIERASADARRQLVKAVGPEAADQLERPGESFSLDELLRSPKLSGEAAAKRELATLAATESVEAARGESDRLRGWPLNSPEARWFVLRQLFLDGVSNALRDRPLLLIDPAIPGRKQLWMLESPPLPMPPRLPSGRTEKHDAPPVDPH